MATTQAQRASLFNTLTDLMGTDEAETLMQQLPPGGWDSMATKDDLQVLSATFTAALAESRVDFTNALAEAARERAEIVKAVSEGFAQAAKERAEIVKAVSEGFAQAARERAEIVKAVSEGFAQAAKERAEIVKANSESHSDLVLRHSDLVLRHSELVESFAGLVKSQARHLYITVSTVVLATISIWIALLAVPTGG